MLSSAGLINYFGHVSDLREVKMSPILLEKGDAKLALYGLSAIKDERLHRLFVEKKVLLFLWPRMQSAYSQLVIEGELKGTE